MFETFISYAWRDGADFAERLEAALPGSWRDKNAINRVRGFDREIEKAIKACKWFVLCCSQDILREDSFVRDEMIYARLHKKPIIVVRLQDITPPISVIRQSWIDYFRLGWDATLKEIRRVMALPPEQLTERTLAPAPKRPSARTRLALITSNDPQKNRAQLIARVRHDWIEGILYPTLEDARHVLKIGVAPKSDAVLNHEGFNYTIDPEKTIETIFNDISEGRLLILGDPGAGKTVLLLQLAEALLEQAERSPAARVPVVFNLASWAQTRKPIFDWMNEELKRFYDVRARKALERWMKNDALIFLFDGLDEVKEEARAACLKALNAFQAQHKPPMVVCSRVTDYESLPQKLNLKSAILLKPLSQAQVDQFLAAGSLTRLKRLVESDAVVQEMSRNPFLLNTMAYAYDDSNPDLQGMSRPRDPAERREHLFDAYIRRRFAESLRKPYDLDDTLRYLRFLAKNMQAYSQTIFRPELIDERWLDEALPEWIKKDVVKNTVRSVAIWLMLSFVGLIIGLSLKIAWWLVLFGILLCSIVLSVTVSSWQLFERPFERLQFNAKRLWIAFRIRRKRLIPSNLQAFIHFTITLKIMRAYGGGFVFAHRYLRETLAGLDGAAVLAKRASKDSEAFAQLVEMTEQTPDILISLLKHKDSDVRRIAVEALGQLGDAQAVEPLIGRLGDGSWYVRRAAAEALVKIGAPAVEPLIGRLGDDNSNVRRAAAEALDKLAWQAQEQAQQVAYLIAKQSWNELVQIGVLAVEPLIARLVDGDEDVRSAAAEALGRLGDARAVEPLIARLNDNYWNVRSAAAKALGRLGDARAVELLIARLGDDNSDVRSAAAEALVKIGAPAVEPLIGRLGDDNWNVRRAAAKALGRLGDARAVEPLIGRLGDDNWNVRRAAAEVLGRLGDAQAVEPLIGRLGDDNWNVRCAAAEALGRLGDAQAVEPLIGRLVDGDEDVRRAAAEALVKIGAPAVEPLIARLGDDNSNVRRAAAEALDKLAWQAQTQAQQIAYLIAKQSWNELVQIGAPSVEPLIARLGDADSNVRRAAAEALGRLGDVQAVEPLIARLNDDYWNVRSAAAEALVKIGAPAVEPLIAHLGYDNSNVRRAAAEALGRLGDARAVEPLIARLNDNYWNVRSAAAKALGQLGDARAIELLIARLGDDNSDVRRAAAEALGQLGDARAIEPLIARLGDDNSDVRSAAAEALGRLGDARAVEPLIARLNDDYWNVRSAAAEALGRLGGDARAVEPLIARLNDNYWNVRSAAAEALVKIGAPAVEPLIAHLGYDNSNVRRAAAEALGRLGDARAVEPLIARLNDNYWNVRSAAAEALDKLAWQAQEQAQQVAYLIAKQSWNELVQIGVLAVEPLIERLGDANRDVRRAAAEALVKIGAPAVEPLIARLGDADSNVRRAAAEALGQLGDARAVKPLIARLNDDYWNVRSAAAEALGQLGDARAVKPLIARLNDDYWNVRSAAAEALRAIGTPEALAALKAWRRRRQ